MRVVEKKPLVIRISDEIRDLELAGKKVDYIELTEKEVDEIQNYFNHLFTYAELSSVSKSEHMINNCFAGYPIKIIKE